MHGRWTLVAAAVLFGTAVGACAQEQSKDPRCESGITQEMVACTAEQTAQWDKRLNNAYRKALNLAEPQQREQLRKAQRLWLQYRDANCLYWALGEGTIARLESAGCMLSMTRSRAEELENAAER